MGESYVDVQKNIPAAESGKFTGPELDAQAMCVSKSIRPAWLESRGWGDGGEEGYGCWEITGVGPGAGASSGVNL